MENYYDALYMYGRIEEQHRHKASRLLAAVALSIDEGAPDDEVCFLLC
jgi:hypothetical protein